MAIDREQAIKAIPGRLRQGLFLSRRTREDIVDAVLALDSGCSCLSCDCRLYGALKAEVERLAKALEWVRHDRDRLARGPSQITDEVVEQATLASWENVRARYADSYSVASFGALNGYDQGRLRSDMRAALEAVWPTSADGGPYEPCVVDADGRCTRWSHGHEASKEEER